MRSLNKRIFLLNINITTDNLQNNIESKIIDKNRNKKTSMRLGGSVKTFVSLEINDSFLVRITI
jgi:hypothetical protein